jgi:hypothetical protein
MYNPFLLLIPQSSPTRLSSIPQRLHTPMMTACQLLPSTQRLHPQHSCYRLAFRSIAMATSVKVHQRQPHRLSAHSHSTWRISVPSPLFSQLPIVCHPSSFVERLVLRPRGTCCSCSKASLAPALGSAQRLNCDAGRVKNGLEHT